jgi:hypothetical protein
MENSLSLVQGHYNETKEENTILKGRIERIKGEFFKLFFSKKKQNFLKKCYRP